MPKKFICDIPAEKLKQLYITEGHNLEEMCEFVGVKSPITMSKILREKGIDTNRNSATAQRNRRGMSDDEFAEYLKNEYKEKSINQIAESLGVTQEAVRKYFKKYGIHFKPTKEAQGAKGEKNPRWRGGRHLRNGYYEVYSPDHPRKSKRNCVYEHDLVMEQHIGRYLRDGEVVHHIDGCKTNNNIENLRLMTNKEHTALHMKERWKKGEK